MRSSFGRDSSDGYCVAFAQSLGHVLIAYTPVGLYAGSLSRPRLTPETSAVPAYSKFGDRNFAPTGQRGRRDIAEQRSARTRLSLRLIFPQNSRCFCFAPQKKSNETEMYGEVARSDGGDKKFGNRTVIPWRRKALAAQKTAPACANKRRRAIKNCASFFVGSHRSGNIAGDSFKATSWHTQTSA